MILLLEMFQENCAFKGRELVCIVNGIDEELLMGKHRSIKKYKFDSRVTFQFKIPKKCSFVAMAL